jgi:hypothetical protein
MGEQDFRMRQVGRHFDGGHGDHADARILDVQAQQVGELALDLVTDSLRAL